MALTNLTKPPQGVLNIFLSSTVRDYEDLRRQVQDVLCKEAKCACFLSEDWVESYSPTIAVCRQRVQESGGFILMLGHWYGSIPPGEEKSITHLEFEWAFEKWASQPFPNMAVLRPQQGSAVDKKLKELARQLTQEMSLEEMVKHTNRLKRFHDQVDDKRCKWRIICSFKNKHDLREKALIFGLTSQGCTPMAAAQGRVEVKSETVYSCLPDDKLGQIGRKPHCDAIQAILSNVVVYPHVPAMAILVQGDGDVGQYVFLSHVVATLLKDYYPADRTIRRLPVESTSTPKLVYSLARTLLGTKVGGIETPEQLAEQVVEQLLKYHPVYFSLDRIGDLAGGIPVFREQFWLPFWKRLEALRTEGKVTHRLVALVTDYTVDSTRWGEAVTDPDSEEAEVDYTKLLLIPKLGPFKRKDLLVWFERMKVSDNGGGRRMKLANRILKDEQGNPDPDPLHVFYRLCCETL